MRKIVGAFVATVLIGAVLSAGARADESPIPASSISYSDYLATHVATGAAAFAQDLVTNARLPIGGPAGYTNDYGHAGCTAPQPYQIGDVEQFWVSPNVANTPQSTKQIDAVLAAKSKHGYFWVEEQFYVPIGDEPTDVVFVSKAEADDALLDWEKIYPKNRTYFGQEPKKSVVPKNLPPGLPKNWRDADCDNRIHILNFPIDTPGASTGYIAGYYSSEHEYPNGDKPNQSPYSNEKEMFFMNSAMLDAGNATYAGVLAHEFFHMIQFGNDFNEATWVNEGMADVAAVVNGFGEVVNGHISAYEDEPDQSLFDWKSDVADYGQAFLFFDYLFNHYGKPENKDTKKLEAYGLARLLTRTSADGDKGISKVLASRSKGLRSKLDPYFRKGSFRKVFVDYVVANFLDLPNAANGQFGYANRNVEVSSAGNGDSSPADSTVHPYGADYHEITGKGRVKTTAEDPVPVIPAKQGMPKGKFFAWGNRSDEMVTHLQRKADLTGATAPSLRFRYWYQIEEDWDYAYVRVSTNGGRTWEFQNTSACGGRATDPNGNNRAVTESGGITGNSDGWKTCTLDLTDHAGDKVVVRFEYDTDQAVTEPGFVVDNVSVRDGATKIWGPSKFETKGGSKPWRFGGDGILKFLRMQPMAKNRPLYQIVQVDGTNSVRRKVMTRGAFLRKNKQLESRRRRSFNGEEKTVLIFSGVTPIATDPFGYSYDVKRSP